MADAPLPMIFLPLTQEPRGLTVVLKGNMGEGELRRLLRETDPTIFAPAVRTYRKLSPAKRCRNG